MNNLYIPKNLKKQRKIQITPEYLIKFEKDIKEVYEDGKIPAPVHLTGNNESPLIEIFQYIHQDDWVFCSWRNHYQALLHGVDRDTLFNDIVVGRSMSINSVSPKLYSSSIVGGNIPIALGAALALKLKKTPERKVWCFVGDMTWETGVCHEAYKYATNFNLPLQFVVEDNGMSTNTPSTDAWGGLSMMPSDVIYYEYERMYPHHGTGNWVLF